MKRFLLLLAAATAALAVVLPATAGAATFRGVVIAKDSARKALVTASRDGTVRTVRLRAGFRRVGVGAVVVVRGSKLADGTFSAAGAKRVGMSRHAHVRGTVVKRLGQRLVLSAGGSVFALRLSGKAGASATRDALRAGDRVDGRTRVRRGGLEAGAGDLEKVGHDGQLVLEGIYLATDSNGTIELAVVHRGRVFVKVPAGMEVPTFKPGDEIALVVTVEADGSFTLVKAENEDGEEEFSVAGILASVTDESVSVKVEHHEEPVSCDVPDGFDLTGFEVGQRVFMTCKGDDDGYVLVSLKHKEAPPPPPGELYAQGTVSALDATHVALDVDGHAEPVSCAVPDGMNLLGFAVGDVVKMTCVKNDQGVFLVKTLVSDHASISPDGSWFVLEGVISALSGGSISLDVDGRDDPVTCAVAPGADLSAFSVGDAVRMKCKLIGGTFTLKLLDSDSAHYELA